MEKINMFAYFPKIYTLYFAIIAIVSFLIIAFFQSFFAKRLYNLWDGNSVSEEIERQAKLLTIEKRSFMGIFNVSFHIIFLTEEGEKISFRLNKHDIRYMNSEEGAEGMLISQGGTFIDFVENGKGE